MKTILVASAFVFFGYHCLAQNVSNYSAQIPNQYMDFALKLTVETSGFTPPVASRAYGFLGMTMYEALVHGIPSQVSLVNKLYQFTSITQPSTLSNYHWPTVVNNALAMVVDSLWSNASSTNKDSLHAIKDYYNLQSQGQLSNQVYDFSKSFGEAIALDVFAYSKTDGCHEGYYSNFPSNYTIPVGSGMWVPLANQSALQPYWGFSRPFLLANTANIIPGPPPVFSTDVNSTFYNYALDVYNQSLNNTPEQVIIAQYWADGSGTITPPGHSMAILKNIIVHENLNLEQATLLYAKLGMALSDAFKASWKTKYLYNCLRPITYINNNIDANWTPLIQTPPFPEYSSGHSSQSGAMMEVLESFFGQNYAFVDSVHGQNFGGPRSFNSISEAAHEAALSRLYGGIHFEFGNEVGLQTGRDVGTNINNLFNQALSSIPEADATSELIFYYPNPTKSILNLDPMNGHFTYFEVFDLLGKNMHVDVYESTKIDVSRLNPGLYVLVAYDSARQNPVKKTFVKE